jgi:hypothetical protein
MENFYVTVAKLFNGGRLGGVRITGERKRRERKVALLGIGEGILGERAPSRITAGRAMLRTKSSRMTDAAIQENIVGFV